MKKLIISVFVLLAFKSNGQNNPLRITKKDSANIVQLQNTIAFKDEMKRSFDGLIFCWYNLERKKGLSSEKSFLNTIDSVAAKLSEFIPK